jgi:hypothetical protein
MSRVTCESHATNPEREKQPLDDGHDITRFSSVRLRAKGTQPHWVQVNILVDGREKRVDGYFSEWMRSFPIHGVIAQSLGANGNSWSGNGEFTKTGHNADLNDHSKEAPHQCPLR